MIVIGLTGSVGMGKSTTAAMFADEGVPVFDADACVHALYSSRAVEPVEAAFPGIVIDGVVDRETLGRRVFASPHELRRLEAIIHPLVREERETFLARQTEAGAAMVVLDIPLLFETASQGDVDVVVLASAPESVQNARVLARPSMTEARFAAITANQMPDAEKRRRVRYVIETGEGFEAAAHQVRAVIAAIEADNSRA